MIIELASSTYYDEGAAARRVKKDERTIRRWVADGLPTHELGRYRLIREDELLAMLRRRLRENPARKRIEF